MKIACVHLSVARALTASGHQCLEVRPPSGAIRLGPLLGDFAPDLIIQQETLGPRTLLMDLPDFACLKVFWSIDTHLNSFWQIYYARLFDLVCSTQQQWVAWLRAQGVAQTLWLPWFGTQRPLVPWEQRESGLCFVGRITEERPVRQWFVDWLNQCAPLDVHQNLSHAAMLERYDRSRVVPNEAIFGEVNFRLFEAGSCGCALLSPAVGHVDELFLPGEEVVLFHDGLELAYWVRRLQTETQWARMLGLRMRQRIWAEHLEEHRASQLLAAILQASSVARRDVGADIAWWLALEQLWAAGRAETSRTALEQAFFALPADEEVLAALLRLRSLGDKENFLRLAVPVIQRQQYQESTLVNLAGSLGALRHAELALARAFWMRQLRGRRVRGVESGPSEVSICLAWSRELQRHGQTSRPGFVFNPQRNIAQSALECVILASEYAPQDKEVYRALQQILARVSGWEALRLKALSYVGLRERENWRLGLELGVTNCRAFRVTQGLEELLLAQHAAAAQGEGERFRTLLAGMDVSGQIRVALASAVS